MRTPSSASGRAQSSDGLGGGRSGPMEPCCRPWIAAVAAAAAVFCAAVVLIPMAEVGGLAWASWGRLALKPACHQITERCLDLGAGPLPICARCAGLYAGGLAGLALTACRRRRILPGWKWLAVAVTPSVIDFTLGLLELPDLSNWPRFAAAFIPGLLLGMVLADAICATVVLNRRESRTGPIT